MRDSGFVRLRSCLETKGWSDGFVVLLFCTRVRSFIALMCWGGLLASQCTGGEMSLVSSEG